MRGPLYSRAVYVLGNAGVNREEGERGVCGASDVLRLGRAALHWWEEPCLVGDKGSGAVFFCIASFNVYCQNRELVSGSGVQISLQQFKEMLLRLQNEEHAANINLVTLTHYTPSIAAAFGRVAGFASAHYPRGVQHLKLRSPRR